MKKITLFLLAICFTMLAYSQATYEVGKVYEINGSKGLVYKVSANGRHGMMMSIQSCPKKQSALVSDKAMFAAAKDLCKDEENGMNNMKAVEAYINEHNLSWSKFPSFGWAHDLGDGWYIPSKKEMMEMVSVLYEGAEFVNGLLTGKDKMLKTVRKELKDNGGAPYIYPMMTSTATSYTNKKGKVFYWRWGLYQLSNQSSGGLLGAILSVAAEATVDKIQVSSGFYYNSKFAGSRAIKSF